MAISELTHLSNSLSTSVQLETSSSQLDGVPKDLEDSMHFETVRLTQAAGILLRLPQELIAQSIVILQRFWVRQDGGSLLEHDSKDVAAAALYLTAKPSGSPISVRQTVVVFEYLNAVRPNFSKIAPGTDVSDVEWRLTMADYEAARSRLYEIEARILRVLGFQTHVALPYTLCINYLQTLDVFNSPNASQIAKRAFAHLNTALLSQQLLYLTHQPTALATAAIYLAARELDVKLPSTNWWEVFDVDREELGFVVVALRSVDGFALEEAAAWQQRKVPLTVKELRAELKQRGHSINGD